MQDRRILIWMGYNHQQNINLVALMPEELLSFKVGQELKNVVIIVIETNLQHCAILWHSHAVFMLYPKADYLIHN